MRGEQKSDAPATQIAARLLASMTLEELVRLRDEIVVEIAARTRARAGTGP